MKANMEKMISVCGNICNECAAFKATVEDDDSKRKETAEAWSKRYSTEIRPEDINCHGCMSTEGKKFNYCGVCEIRKCGFEKGAENCACCDEYTCDKLEGFFKSVPDNRKVLDNIRNTIE